MSLIAYSYVRYINMWHLCPSYPCGEIGKQHAYVFRLPYSLNLNTIEIGTKYNCDRNRYGSGIGTGFGPGKDEAELYHLVN